MTRVVMPGMVERGRGVVINNASALAISPMPILTVYSATKVCACGGGGRVKGWKKKVGWGWF